jgi:hypothetical protein
MQIKLKWELLDNYKITSENGGIWKLKCNDAVVGRMDLTSNDDIFDSVDANWLGSGDPIKCLENESYCYDNEAGDECMTLIEEDAVAFFENCFPDCIVTIDGDELVKLLDTKPKEYSNGSKS